MPSPPDAQPPTEVEIRRALESPESLCINFQPVADLRRGAVAGFEVLARFGEVRPDTWFASAGLAGLGPRADRAIVARALEARRTLPENTFLTINVAPDSIVDPALRDLLDGAADLRGVVFEITEHAPVHDYPLLSAAIERLRAQGAMIAVDDAGAGYSSMRHVLALRPHFVKVDREFVTGCDGDPARMALIEAIAAYAGRLDAWIIAEGVETVAELRALMDLGIPLAQGFLFGEAKDGWSGLSTEARDVIRERGTEPAGTVVACIATTAGEPGLLRDGDIEWQVMPDERGHPAGLLSGGQRRGLMSVTASTDAATALSRALTRGPAMRFDPIAVIADTGHLLGLAPIDRLVRAALATR